MNVFVVLGVHYVEQIPKIEKVLKQLFYSSKFSNEYTEIVCF